MQEIMVTNLQCVRPCYANNASGIGPASEKEIWHDESLRECRNIYFTPLVVRRGDTNPTRGAPPTSSFRTRRA